MTSLQVAVLILIATDVLAALLWQWYRSHIFKRASGLARRVFPVWAAQGPFDSGEESAAAMRHAYLAVFGAEEAEKRGMVEAISKHASAYDSNPAAWEQNRQQAMQSANTETEEFVTIAKGLAAIDSLNKDFLESGGHKLELARQSHGSMGIAYKKIWSDEAIEEKKKQDNEAIVSGIGKGLLEDNSEEARALVAFLAEIYKANTEEEEISASAIGRAWLACFTMKNEDPDSDLARKFERLNDAHQANLESTDGTLQWSNDPGAYESHLMRRHNNPYFPESRRNVSLEDLQEAKKKDEDDYISCQRRLEGLAACRTHDDSDVHGSVEAGICCAGVGDQVHEARQNRAAAGLNRWPPRATSPSGGCSRPSSPATTHLVPLRSPAAGTGASPSPI